MGTAVAARPEAGAEGRGTARTYLSAASGPDCRGQHHPRRRLGGSGGGGSSFLRLLRLPPLPPPPPSGDLARAQVRSGRGPAGISREFVVSGGEAVSRREGGAMLGLPPRGPLRERRPIGALPQRQRGATVPEES